MKKFTNKSLFTVSAFFLVLLIGFSTPASAATVHVLSQDVTTYVAPRGSTTFNGKTPKLTYVAVHPSTWGTPTRYTKPIIPFGATIITDSSLNVPNAGGISAFSVQDIGDVENDRGLTLYWFDIYIGTNSAINIALANDFGKQKVNYKYIY